MSGLLFYSVNLSQTCENKVSILNVHREGYRINSEEKAGDEEINCVSIEIFIGWHQGYSRGPL